MTQRAINTIFLKSSNSVNSMDEDEPQPTGSEKTVAYYENMIQQQDFVKSTAKIVPEYSGGSECWKHFGSLYIGGRWVLKQSKFCCHCFQESTKLKAFGCTTSTTNYRNHLSSVHDIDAKNILEKKNLGRTAKCLSGTASISKFTHARMLAEMCCLDLQPFKIVERKGFQKYIARIDSKLCFPTSTTLSTTALNDVYNVYLSAVTNALNKSPQEMTLILDMWTDRQKKLSYINIKLHFCENFEIKSFSLKTEYFPHPHTAEAIAANVLETLKKFNLNKKTLRAVSDGGSNIVAALKIDGIQRFNCLAHSIHRFIAHDIFNDMRFATLRDAIMKLKKIFRSLTYKGEEIRQLQELKNSQPIYELIQSIDEYVSMDNNIILDGLETNLETAMRVPNTQTLKNSVETRWNSLLKMVKSFLENIEPINIALFKLNAKKDMLILDMEKALLEEFAKFLEIFEEATTYLQGQEYATLSMCIYFCENINAAVAEKAQTAEFGTNITLYKFTENFFCRRFKILKIHVVAALMDPCQKNWSVLNKYIKKIPPFEVPDNFVLESEYADALSKDKLIHNEIMKLKRVELPSTSGNSHETLAKKMKMSETRKKMFEIVSESDAYSVSDLLIMEVHQYFDVAVTGSESLDWWKENQKKFPRVAQLANVCFGIPATSASSEMAFSVAGSCISEKRSNLNPSTVKKQLFIHDNYKAVQNAL